MFCVFIIISHAANSSNKRVIFVNVFSKLLVVHFWAPWAPMCQQMNDVMDILAKDSRFTSVGFLKVTMTLLSEVRWCSLL